MITKEQILKEFELFKCDLGGICTLFSVQTHEMVFERLAKLDSQTGNKLSMEEFNQLLVLANEGSVSSAFFNYYWYSKPSHTYDIKSIEGYSEEWDFTDENPSIINLQHMRWGFYRLYIDGLLYFGNVRTAFRILRVMNEKNIGEFFNERKINSDLLRKRGPRLPLNKIDADDRHFVSEMVCKTYGISPLERGEFLNKLLEAWEKYTVGSNIKISFRDLIALALGKDIDISKDEETGFDRTLYAQDDVLDKQIESKDMLIKYYHSAAEKFLEVRDKAEKNTKLFLSMVNELDVYVATSMRNREDFRKMVKFCDKIFNDSRLKEFQLRYFDPTMSAAEGHEDKGLIECLMVKCTKALVYYAGEKDSYGKDAEVAIALSLGKPVIFFCSPKRAPIFKEIHPLARLIEINTGVAIGGIIATTEDHVAELLRRIFANEMQYKIEKHIDRKNYIRLIEKLTNSAVRVQSDDETLTQAFWNHYHNKP